MKVYAISHKGFPHAIFCDKESFNEFIESNGLTLEGLRHETENNPDLEWRLDVVNLIIHKRFCPTINGDCKGPICVDWHESGVKTLGKCGKNYRVNAR